MKISKNKQNIIFYKMRYLKLCLSSHQKGKHLTNFDISMIRWLQFKYCFSKLTVMVLLLEKETLHNWKGILLQSLAARSQPQQHYHLRLENSLVQKDFLYTLWLLRTSLGFSWIFIIFTSRFDVQRPKISTNIVKWPLVEWNYSWMWTKN